MSASPHSDSLNHAIDAFAAWAAPRLETFLAPSAEGPRGYIGDAGVERQAATLLTEAEQALPALVREYLRDGSSGHASARAMLIAALEAEDAATIRDGDRVDAIDDERIWHVFDADGRLTQLAVDACANTAGAGLSVPRPIATVGSLAPLDSAGAAHWAWTQDEYERLFGPMPRVLDAIDVARLATLLLEHLPASDDRLLAVRYAPERRTPAAERALRQVGTGSVWESLIVAAARREGRALVLPIGADQAATVAALLRGAGWSSTDVAQFARLDPEFEHAGRIAVLHALFSRPEVEPPRRARPARRRAG